MQCVDCEYMHPIKNSDGETVDICVCADSGAYLQEVGVCGNCSWDGYEALEPLYHVTLLENVSDILQKGLLPQIGVRSASCGESEPFLYLFPDKERMENAVQNWLGEQFEENAELAILELRLPLSYKWSLIAEEGAGYEVKCTQEVPMDYIRVFSEAMEPLTGDAS